MVKALDYLVGMAYGGLVSGIPHAVERAGERMLNTAGSDVNTVSDLGLFGYKFALGAGMAGYVLNRASRAAAGARISARKMAGTLGVMGGLMATPETVDFLAGSDSPGQYVARLFVTGAVTVAAAVGAKKLFA